MLLVHIHLCVADISHKQHAQVKGIPALITYSLNISIVSVHVYMSLAYTDIFGFSSLLGHNTQTNIITVFSPVYFKRLNLRAFIEQFPLILK